VHLPNGWKFFHVPPPVEPFCFARVTVRPASCPLLAAWRATPVTFLHLLRTEALSGERSSIFGRVKSRPFPLGLGVKVPPMCMFVSPKQGGLQYVSIRAGLVS
jgi:hypothetical protein